jgi:hypothetical protein
MYLVLEPEGAEFLLAPGDIANVHLSGEGPAVVLKCSRDALGRCRISFWPDKGTYEIFVNGKRVWDLL